MNTRWTLEEEKKLIRQIKHSSDLSSLAKELNRSENALELRIKKIIYDSVAGNKSIENISKSLNLSEDRVKQYFYSYKDMMEKNGKNTVDIVENKDKNDILTNIKLHIDEKKESKHDSKFVSKGGSRKHSRKEHSKKDSKKHSKKDSKKEHSNSTHKIDLDKLKKQNDKMETILKNIQLKNEIKKALKTNKLDKHEIQIVKGVI
jgi:hypothetical protein